MLLFRTSLSNMFQAILNTLYSELIHFNVLHSEFPYNELHLELIYYNVLHLELPLKCTAFRTYIELSLKCTAFRTNSLWSTAFKTPLKCTAFRTSLWHMLRQIYCIHNVILKRPILMLCLCLGSLQLVTSIPTHKLPHMFSWGASTTQEIEELDRDEPDSMGAEGDDMGRRGQILWIRGLTRLQHQVGSISFVLPPYSWLLSTS